MAKSLLDTMATIRLQAVELEVRLRDLDAEQLSIGGRIALERCIVMNNNTLEELDGYETHIPARARSITKGP